MGMVKLLFSFQGRINRAQYWAGGVAVGVVVCVAVALSAATLTSKSGGAIFVGLLVPILFMGCTWCSMSLHVKRLHDRGRSGYLALLFLLPVVSFGVAIMGAATQDLGAIGLSLAMSVLNFFINLFFLVDLGTLPSKPGPNRYGDDPSTGGASTPPSVRPAKGGPSAGSLDNAQTAMERAIAAQSRFAGVAQPSALGAPRTASAAAPTASPPAHAHAPQHASPSAPSGAPKAFGRRAAQ
jgi:uncharacterized membrane protein YhaH (DUF805 family)